MPYVRTGNLIDGQDVGYWCRMYVEEQKRADAMTDALKITALSMDLRAGWKITEEAYERVLNEYGGAMAASYIKVCEALGECRVTKTDGKEEKEEPEAES